MRLLFTGVLALVLACPALAQEVYPTVEFGIAHALLRDNKLDVNDNGFVFSAAANPNRWFGLETEVSGQLDMDSWSYAGGPRFILRRRRTSSYLNVLVGGVHRSASSRTSARGFEPTAQVGGGLNVWMTPDVGINIGGAYRQVYGDFGFDRSEVRFSIGAVFALGTRF